PKRLCHARADEKTTTCWRMPSARCCGRKAFLFAGSQQAAELTAAMYSFMASCKKNGINEVEGLKDVFERIQSHKQKDLYQLLPNNWQAIAQNPTNNTSSSIIQK